MEEFVKGLEAYLHASLLMSMVAAFLGGVLASATPCVYPLVPITASYIGSSNLGGSKLRGFILSFVYVTGVAVTYASLGIIAALTGHLFGEISTNPWVYLVVANIFIILGLGMLELYSIPMIAPTSSRKPATVVGAFFVGIVSGFVAGPCTAPVLAVLLTYVATTQDVLLGASLLFVFAFGMGVLLILVGTFSGALAALPRSGEWMVNIKKALGVIMIGLGEYFLIKMGELMI
ncbi:MAG: sulfite exporter TauE/SafE family protein [Desulfomonile tiedjei]|uniref:Sulfite exporter TauE/SafE family protein n=1 Tax=Desulfomonile tiedjei TaxID=2358 RepID=A0A9D6V126_9BACT|nr:sulfite exporter TauE/SafE family protein [Desulfomonile tiedjei]